MSDAQQRAAEVIRYEIGSEYETLSRSLAKALAAAGLLVDDDTARLVTGFDEAQVGEEAYTWEVDQGDWGEYRFEITDPRETGADEYVTTGIFRKRWRLVEVVRFPPPGP